jgi:ssDNA-binding Zn-finger/Zn-ribbon topoisomerase 1
MNLFKHFFQDRCPKCQKALVNKSNEDSKLIVIKVCPDGHFQKEFHPALETYVESARVS